MMGCTVQRGWTDKEEQCSDHVVANCCTLVFYSAFYRQPVQIYMKVGGWGVGWVGSDMFAHGRQAAQFIKC